MTVREEIRALRAALGETTTTFAARWRRSRRTIEDWEQGRVQPDAFVLDAIRALARAKPVKSRATRGHTKKKPAKG